MGGKTSHRWGGGGKTEAGPKKNVVRTEGQNGEDNVFSNRKKSSAAALKKKATGPDRPETLTDQNTGPE